MLVLRGYQANPTSWSLILEDVKKQMKINPNTKDEEIFKTPEDAIKILAYK